MNNEMKKMNIYMKNRKKHVQWVFLPRLGLCFKILENGQKIRSFDYDRGMKIMRRIYRTSRTSDMISVSGNMISEFDRDEQVSELFSGGTIRLGVQK